MGGKRGFGQEKEFGRFVKVGRIDKMR